MVRRQVAAVSAFDAYETCERCGGTGYAHLMGRLYIVCRGCGGTGERLKTSRKIWRLLRHGLPTGEDY